MHNQHMGHSLFAHRKKSVPLQRIQLYHNFPPCISWIRSSSLQAVHPTCWSGRPELGVDRQPLPSMSEPLLSFSLFLWHNDDDSITDSPASLAAARQCGTTLQQPAISSSSSSLRLQNASPSADRPILVLVLLVVPPTASPQSNRSRFGRFFCVYIPVLLISAARPHNPKTGCEFRFLIMFMKAPKEGIQQHKCPARFCSPPASVFFFFERGGVDVCVWGDCRLRSACCCCCCRLFAGKVTDNKSLWSGRCTVTTGGEEGGKGWG